MVYKINFTKKYNVVKVDAYITFTPEPREEKDREENKTEEERGKEEDEKGSNEEICVWASVILEMRERMV